MCAQTVKWSMYTFSNAGGNFCCVSCSFVHASTQVCVCGAEMPASQFHEAKRGNFLFIFICYFIMLLLFQCTSWMYILVDLGSSWKSINKMWIKRHNLIIMQWWCHSTGRLSWPDVRWWKMEKKKKKVTAIYIIYIVTCRIQVHLHTYVQFVIYRTTDH